MIRVRFTVERNPLRCSPVLGFLARISLWRRMARPYRILQPEIRRPLSFAVSDLLAAAGFPRRKD